MAREEDEKEKDEEEEEEENEVIVGEVCSSIRHVRSSVHPSVRLSVRRFVVNVRPVHCTGLYQSKYTSSDADAAAPGDGDADDCGSGVLQSSHDSREDYLRPERR